jgi:hypothetical protein
MDEKSFSLSDRKNMSFRQAEGMDVPVALKWGELDKDLRLEIWNVLHGWLEMHRISRADILHSDVAKNMAQVLRKSLKIPVDEALGRTRSLSSTHKVVKEIILAADYSVALELVQTMAREFADGGPLLEALDDAFSANGSPYAIVGPPPTVIPRGIPIEGRSASDEISTISNSSLRGALAHLMSAASALNRGDPRDSIRESIHAVESAARQVTGQDKAMLPDALKLLEKENGLHPALKEGFIRLYGYTSDEKGIRHALLESDNKDGGVDEALFMFSACAAFVSFLARKFPERDVAE